MPQVLKFLVIDDDTAIRTTLSDILEVKGFDVVAVGTGTEGIDKVKSEDFDVAIIDIRLPDIKGTEVLKQIKRTKPQINCIIITAYPEEDPSNTLSQGASGFFIKPIDLDEMLSVIEKVVGGK